MQTVVKLVTRAQQVDDAQDAKQAVGVDSSGLPAELSRMGTRLERFRARERRWRQSRRSSRRRARSPRGRTPRRKRSLRRCSGSRRRSRRVNAAVAMTTSRVRRRHWRRCRATRCVRTRASCRPRRSATNSLQGRLRADVQPVDCPSTKVTRSSWRRACRTSHRTASTWCRCHGAVARIAFRSAVGIRVRGPSRRAKPPQAGARRPGQGLEAKGS